MADRQQVQPRVREPARRARYRVVWAADARLDLLEIVSFIAEQSPGTARRVAQRLLAGAASLSHHPQRSRRVPELAALTELAGLLAPLEVRELIVRPWRLVYQIAGPEVRVVAVVDSRRDMVAWLERHLARRAFQGGPPAGRP